MRRVCVFILFFLLIATPTLAQEPSKGEFHLWMEAFSGSEGSVLYPQYGWRLETKAGRLSGYGFLESAPHEPLFTNHLLIFTPGKQGVFSVRTETGGLPDAKLGFFQVGPQANLHEVVPRTKKVMSHMVVTVLPKFKGIRTTNFLVGFGSNRFRITKKTEVWIEGYRRFFDGADYAEYWLLVHPKALGPISVGAFVLHHGKEVSTSFGGRLSLF